VVLVQSRRAIEERGMPQQAIEVILMRQLANYLAMPIFLVDSSGDLLFYNEPAEVLFGHRYEETGEMPLSEWAQLFQPTSENGSPLATEALPLVIALQQHRAVHSIFHIRGLDGMHRKIEATAFPLEGQGGRHLGAVAIFWEVRP
jgi:PAS domain-containing protein